MDSRTHKALQSVWGTLPPDFRGDVYDDCITYRRPMQFDVRAIRIVGPERCVVLFRYEPGVLERSWHFPSHSRGDYTLHYLHEDGDVRPLDVMKIRRDWEVVTSRYLFFPWEREVGKWLLGNGAKTFTGMNWVGRISESLVTLIPRWMDEFSGLTHAIQSPVDTPTTT